MSKILALYLPFGGFQPRRDAMGSQSLELHFVTVEDGSKVRNVSDYDEEFAAFDDFTLRMYVRWENVSDKRPEWTIGSFDAEYISVYSVDLRKAERMTALLRKIGKLRFPVTPKTFGQYVALMCQALKVKTIARALNNADWHTETDHDIADVKYLESTIDCLVYDFQMRVRPDLRPDGWTDSRERAA